MTAQSWRAQPTRFQDGLGKELTRVALGGGSQLDAFGRLRVSNPALTLFDSQQHYNNQPLLWNTKLTAGGLSTFDPNEAGSFLTVTNNGDQVIRQTKQYHRYQPGKSQALKATGTMFGSGDMYIVQRSSVSGSVVEQRIPQSQWNFDVFNGNGSSGITADFTKSQIFFIDIEWLAVGQVRAGFVHGGVVAFAHIFSNENQNPGAYMKTANLPVRYEVTSDNGIVYLRIGYFDNEDGIFFEKQLAGTSGQLLQICCAVESEGGFEETLGIPHSGNTGSGLVSVTTRRPLFSFRPKATFNGIVNRGSLIPLGFQAHVEGQPAMFEIVYNGVLTGAAWTSAGTDSIAEYDASATTITGGQVIYSIPISGSKDGVQGGASVVSKLPLTLDIDGANPTILSLVATRIATTGSADIAIGANWRELY